LGQIWKLKLGVNL